MSTQTASTITLQVTTASSGVFLIHDASALGMDAVIGRTSPDAELRTFQFADSDTVAQVTA